MTFWTDRRVVITGAEGFIGSTLTDLLVDAGADVTAFAHYKPYGEHGFIADHVQAGRVKVVAGDIRDHGQVQDVVAGADTVFHLAALIGIPYSYEAPDSYVQANVVGTHNVVAAARRHGTRRVVTTSTSEVYGTAQTVPISEDHPLQPQSPYSASKIGGDMMAMSYFLSFETPVTIVRPFNTYGPRQSARAVIPAILQQLHSGAKEIKLGLLTPTRDFTYSTDTASGFIAAAEHDGAVGLGGGDETGRCVGRVRRDRAGPSPHPPRGLRGDAPARRQLPRARADRLGARRLPRGRTGAHVRMGCRQRVARRLPLRGVAA